MFEVSYDGFTFETPDPIFAYTIPRGQSEPYPRDLAIVRRYLRTFPNRCRTYIDAGAHIGTTIAPYSRMFRTLVGFEPMPDTYALLERNMKRNSIACQVEQCALYDRECRADISMHAGGNTGCYFIQEKEAGRVKCRPLDAYQFADVDFLKIDVEGSELAVLRGAVDTLRRFKPFLQVEWNGLGERIYGTSRSELDLFLSELGYCLYAEEGANLFFYVPRIEPYRIVCYWGKSTPSTRRNRSIEGMASVSQCDVMLLSPQTFQDIALPAHPVHPAFPYLSEVHQSDYVRTYVMHHFGGGYSDVKPQSGSWRSAFDRLLESDAYVVGYPETGPGGVAYLPAMDAWTELVGNGAYICKPKTALTQEWFDDLHRLLDSKFELIKSHPATHPRDKAEDGRGYPIEWNEMLGRIFHRVSFNYREKLLRILPMIDVVNYT